MKHYGLLLSQHCPPDLERTCRESQRQPGRHPPGTPGDYQVTLTACNIYDKCDTALATIRIPEGEVPEPEPTEEPEPTPTSMPPNPPAISPPEPPVEIVEIIAEAIPEVVARLAIWLLPLAGIVGSLAALGINHIRDPRPAAICKLGRLLARRADE